MIAAIDGFEWRARPTGVGRFLQNVLAAMAPQAPGHRFVLFLPAPLAAPPAWPNLETVVAPHAGGFFRWQNQVLPGLIARHGCDRLWAPNNVPPLRTGVPTLVTVHDVSWRGVPADYSLRERLSLDLRARWGLRRAAVVAADSAFSAAEVSRWYGIGRDRVRVVHLGRQPGLRRAGGPEIAAFRARHGLAGRTVIGFLGALFGRRHVVETAAAVERLRCGRDAVLLLAGPDRLGDAARRRLDRDWIVRLPWLAEEEIAAFYSSLDLCCYLSEYEGFGLPPMEALQCGTVPLLLPGSSLGELYSGCALFVDRPDPGRVAAAMDSFLERPAARTELLRRWREREGLFSWERTARAYLGLLDSLDGDGVSRRS
jgi:glycosyltransferase involved in cell wall biosynthesis